MKTWIEIFLLLMTLSPTLSSSQLVRELDFLRQTIDHSLIHLEKGQAKMQQKLKSVDRLKQANWNEEVSFFQTKLQEIEMEKGGLKFLDQHLQALQQVNASLSQPKMPVYDTFNDIPYEIQENMAQGTLSLPIQTNTPNTGAPGHGAGFSRACPALNLQEGFVSMIEGQTLEGITGSSGLRIPSTSGYLSAGTWAYPSGALHLGMDLALPMYTPLYAPADGVILYAATPVGDAGGYLGNWSGWPYGGGNTICMLCISNGHLYGVSFCHLSSRVVVRASQMVHQGDILAYSGNTGNSTGPHTHIELFPLKVSFQEAVSYFQQTADFSFGTGWSTPATCSQWACRVRPELYFIR